MAVERKSCHRDDCQGFDGHKYRFHGSQWVRKSVVNDPNDESTNVPTITNGAIIEEGVCEHEKNAFGDLLEPLESDYNSAEEERRDEFDLYDYNVKQLQTLAKELDLSGYSAMNKDQLVDYVGSNAGPSFEPSSALEEAEKEGD